MAWTTAGIPDQSGRVAVVTGANGGLGLEVAGELARRGGHVVMAARDQAKAEAAVTSIRGEIPDASLALQPLDLASLASVREAAARILADNPRIDILVNNAGVMGIPERRTEDGFEMQLAVNHLGHFALTAQLLPALLQSSDARVVSVTSTGRHGGRALDPDNPHLSGRYEPLAGLRAVQAGQPALRARARSAVPRGGGAGAEHRGCTRGSPTPTCRPGACVRPAVAGASGSSTPPSGGSG
jgi:NAD(P)-dependent dehydrogenase (short-subunit alcohol dehydrogenase family)